MEGLSLKTESRGAWIVCGLLFLASAMNYMDRQTLAVTSTRIKAEFELSDEKYGNLEFVFGYAFAAGSLAFGLTVDRMSVRILYPAVLFAWSAMGCLTGFARDYDDLFYCRMLLGFFEGGHWPCALRTTLLLLAPSDRMFGNSVLQSGTSIGAVATPLLVRIFVTAEPGSWRAVFLGIGVAGIGWVLLWWLATPFLPDAPRDETLEADPPEKPPDPWWWVFFNRRFWIVAFVVVGINITWQLLRAWMHLFLVKGRGYSEDTALTFNMIYFLATDVGCLAGGFASRWLHDRGASVFRSRLAVFAVSATICLSCFALPWLSQGWMLLGVLLLIGMATLALFPCYYSWAQEIDPRQQGFVSGLLGTFAWLVSSPLHGMLGRYVDATGDATTAGRYDIGLAWAGLPPILALAVVWFLWNEEPALPEGEKT